MKRSERMIIVTIFSTVAAFTATDMVLDYLAGSNSAHLIIEAILFLASLAGVVYLLNLWWTARSNLKIVSHRLEDTQTDFYELKVRMKPHLAGLGQVIDEQFAAWQLTAAEKNVGLLLLKGLTLEEIADIRQTSERTVRQQAISVYAKAGLSGRAELSAFFLEDLLLPYQEHDHAACS